MVSVSDANANDAEVSSAVDEDRSGAKRNEDPIGWGGRGPRSGCGCGSLVRWRYSLGRAARLIGRRPSRASPTSTVLSRLTPSWLVCPISPEITVHRSDESPRYENFKE